MNNPIDALSGPADYLIVGGGVAGCVLASRLSERPDIRVVLVEAGAVFTPDNEPEPIGDILTRSYLNPAYMWGGLTTVPRPDPEHPEGGVAVPYVHGRVLGGGSSVNGVNVHRGLPADYDEWADYGVAGWGWKDVLPFFRKLETDEDFDGALHGKSGPLHVARIGEALWTPFERLIHEDWRARQLPDMPDINSEMPVGRCAIPIAMRDGRRMSLARAYLTAGVQARENLVILGHTEVTRLLIEGNRAAGAIASCEGRELTLKAHHVVLTAGAVLSPTLLQRAGIGDAEALKAVGIKPILDRPGVGGNLQNHPVIMLAGFLRRHSRVSGRRPMSVSGSRYSSGLPGCDEGDMGGLTFGMVPDATRANPLGRRIGAVAAVVHKVYSRGHIKPSASGPPRVIGNIIGDERDLARLVQGFHIVREQMLKARDAGFIDQIFSPRSMGRTSDDLGTRLINLAAATALDTAATVRNRIFSKAGELLEHIPTEGDALRQWVSTFHGQGYHISGTCRMGRSDDLEAVVDARGRVIGIDGLSIADLSIFPTLVRGGTMVPGTMAAEKIAAGLIAGRS